VVCNEEELVAAAKYTIICAGSNNLSDVQDKMDNKALRVNTAYTEICTHLGWIVDEVMRVGGTPVVVIPTPRRDVCFSLMERVA